MIKKEYETHQILNAIAHRDYSISGTQIDIDIYKDRMQITSHGGIPKEITSDDFFSGVSYPRNNVLMRIFLKLGVVEHTGHGIPIILEKYGRSSFNIHDSDK